MNVSCFVELFVTYELLLEFSTSNKCEKWNNCDDLVFTVRCVNSSACKKKVFSICYTNLLKGWKGQGRGKGREKENRREQDDQDGKGQRGRARKKIS